MFRDGGGGKWCAGGMGSDVQQPLNLISEMILSLGRRETPGGMVLRRKCVSVSYLCMPLFIFVAVYLYDQVCESVS